MVSFFSPTLYNAGSAVGTLLNLIFSGVGFVWCGAVFGWCVTVLGGAVLGGTAILILLYLLLVGAGCRWEGWFISNKVNFANITKMPTQYEFMWIWFMLSNL